MASSGARTVLHLYREVLRTHRTKLPTPMRVLGDSYARDEFRRHKDFETTDKQWSEFIGEWRKYCDMLNGRADLPDTSGYIPEDALDNLSSEQRAQLEKLKREAERLAKGE
mmetsp:Transcript_68077/g.215380  ORF Transcript_68077/g.215380 Transcript_68077/m.215380 type:complete len:111 (+) Transcript_68077:291-623(+)